MENANSQLENEDIQDITKKYLIKIKEQNKLSSKCAEAVTHNYMKTTINTLKRTIHNCLSDAGLDTQDLSCYTNIFEDLTVQLDSELHSFDIEKSDMNLPLVNKLGQNVWD